MRLYDEVINTWSNLVQGCSNKNLKISPLDKNYDEWESADNHQMILRSDMAYELGGSTTSLFALGGTAVTSDEALVPSDEIILIGPDISEIKNDISYARLAIVRADYDDTSSNALYNAIRKIEYVRYHVHPKGYMSRVSSVYGRESIRISKEAIKDGLSFQKAGNIMLREFHKNSDIQAVKLIFITDPDFDYASLEASINTANDITRTIDHIMKDAMTDCSTCSLQKVCDEVEGLRELHFAGKN